MIADFGLLIDFRLAIGMIACPKKIGQLSQCGPDVDQAKTRNGATRVITGHHSAQQPRPFKEIVAFPECRPRDEDQKQARFEQQGDEKKPPEQGLASRLRLRELLDSARHIAVAARLRFEFDIGRERP